MRLTAEVPVNPGSALTGWLTVAKVLTFLNPFPWLYNEDDDKTYL